MASGERTDRGAGDNVPVATVDAIGLNCPMPVLLARKALAKLPAGGRLTVIATDPLAGLDIPNLVREDGHVLVSQRREGDRFIFEIEKRAPAS